MGIKILISLFCVVASFNTTEELNVIREAYREISANEETIEEFYKLTQETMPSSKPVYRGYHGAALTLKASVAGSIKDKLSYFKEGKKLIETAISEAPANIELRMIRLSVQSNVPRIVGYRRNIEEDKAYIQKNISTVTDPALKKLLNGFIKNSGAFSK
ncbi:hypothetical protein ACJRPK_10735 [Aquimarina sp. 2-A2]|uniref:hypothetical protein n=1 Tax=Aquimarina sp. 2-A2 TaxID=3382644 RepID=UPI00387F3647